MGAPWGGLARAVLGEEIGRRQAVWEREVERLSEPSRGVLKRALEDGSGADSTPAPAPAPVGPPRERERPGLPARPVLLELAEEEEESAEGAAAASLPFVSGWPAPLGEAAVGGLAGSVMELIEPHTEADPAAILIQFLVGFGSLVGRGPFVRVDGHDHRVNLFAVVVGDTSRARKGTSWRRVVELLSQADSEWCSLRVLGGLSSGEGLIWAVRDPIWGVEKRHGEEVLIDPGVGDKRLMVVESEFGGALRVLGREGNTLSSILRQGYDGGDLRFMTKNNPAVATAPHLSLCGHVTREELRKHLSSVEAVNGLGNRILWVCARRSKSLPFGGRGDDALRRSMGTYLAGIAADARAVEEMVWAPSGASRWNDLYDDLTESHDGLLGALTSRAEAHTLRLAMVYALLDRRREIAAEHVDAAAAVWRYCADSAAFLFGKAGRSDDVKLGLILDALERNVLGMNRTEIFREVFKCNITADGLSRMLKGLEDARLIVCESVPHLGRSRDRYFIAARPARASS